MDDVLENFVETWVNALNDLFRTNVTEEDVTDWEVSTAFPTLTKEQVYLPLQLPGFWDKMVFDQRASFAMMSWLVLGHTVRIVTASDWRNIERKMMWLFKNYEGDYHEGISWNNVIITQDKSLILGDVFIDDKPQNLETSPAPTKLLFDRPHNRKYPAEKHGMVRVKDWQEIRNFVDELAKEETD